MGLFRYILACLVVYFHFGGGYWTVGRSAVYCFYIISGFLIARVLDQKYFQINNGIVLFYLNRLIRIMPLYFCILLISFIFLKIRGNCLFSVDGCDNSEKYQMVNEAIIKNGISTSDLLFPRNSVQGFFPCISFSPNIIPQGWSIGMEMCYYILAPFIVSLFFFRKKVLLSIVFFISLFLMILYAVKFWEFKLLDNYFYKNFIPSVYFFFFGAILHVVKKNKQYKINYSFCALAAILFTYYSICYSNFGYFFGNEPNTSVFFLNIIIIMSVSIIPCFASSSSSSFCKLDRKIGDLSYGIYLNHFLVAQCMLATAEIFNCSIFGRVNHASFGVWAIALSSIFAFLTNLIVEKPIDKIRNNLTKISFKTGTAFDIN